MDEKSKMQTCRYSRAGMDRKGEHPSVYFKCGKGRKLGEFDDMPIITEETCEECPEYKSRYIEFPATVNEIELAEMYGSSYYMRDAGKLVRVRPCDEKYEGRTLLGLCLGELPYTPTVNLSEDGKMKIDHLYNPAILVLETHELVFGYESWWAPITNKAELRDITDEAIREQPYVKMLMEW